jgi:hypothetical protein
MKSRWDFDLAKFRYFPPQVESSPVAIPRSSSPISQTGIVGHQPPPTRGVNCGTGSAKPVGDLVGGETIIFIPSESECNKSLQSLQWLPTEMPPLRCLLAVTPSALRAVGQRTSCWYVEK